MIDGRFTVNDIAKALDVTPMTIKRWVRWYEENKKAGLPTHAELPVYQVCSNGTRVWFASPDTIEMFRYFRQTMPRGAMAEYNALNSWGKRGRAIAERKITKF